eukprot:10726156-Lingulodinium_polyedra.AAC.1
MRRQPIHPWAVPPVNSWPRHVGRHGEEDSGTGQNNPIRRSRNGRGLVHAENGARGRPKMRLGSPN